MSPSRDMGNWLPLRVVMVANRHGPRNSNRRMVHTLQRSGPERAREADACYYPNSRKYERNPRQTMTRRATRRPIWPSKSKARGARLNSRNLRGHRRPEIWRFDGEDRNVHLRKGRPGGYSRRSKVRHAIHRPRRGRRSGWREGIRDGQQTWPDEEVQEWDRVETAPRLNSTDRDLITTIVPARTPSEDVRHATQARYQLIDPRGGRLTSQDQAVQSGGDESRLGRLQGRADGHR